MPDTPVPTPGEGNQVERTPTGEIKDQSPSPESTSTTQETPTTTPAKPDQTSSTTDDKSLLNKDTPTGAPEKYEDFKVPDGYTLDAEVAKEAGTKFKELNLSQGQAQSLIDFYVAKTQEAFQQPYKAYEDMRKGWVEEVKAHPEIGGKLDQVKTTVARAIDGLGDAKLASDFRQAMDTTGAGDNPAFIRVFYKLAQMVTEGKATDGGKPSPLGQREPGLKPSAAQAMYPTLP